MHDNNCIRILRIVSVMNRGGIETQIMNLYRKIDRTRFQFDFLVTRNQKGIFDDEIRELGGRIYNIEGVKDVGIIRFLKSINYFFKTHREYQIVHSHMNTWSGLFLKIAKKNKVKVRIAQSHSAQKGLRMKSVSLIFEKSIKSLMKLFIKNNSTHYWSVGYEAGEWLFGKEIACSNMVILPNAKSLEIYLYNPTNNDSHREVLKIPKDGFIIGHVGSFLDVKNHIFLIEVFNHILKINPNSFLCLVGEGPLRNDIEIKINNLGINDNVRILGLRNDVHELMSLFNTLVLPSKFEGMPNVVIEAQAAGLPCVLSNKIPKEIDMGNNLVEFVSLSESIERWAEIILNCKLKIRSTNLEKLREKGYDINSQITWLEGFYDSVLN
jgi:glycosyltransferase involved in cell wall biosynthesis